MKIKELKTILTGLFAEDNLKRLFEKLNQEISPKSSQYTTFLMLKRRFNALQNRIMANTISHESMKIDENQIGLDLLSFIGLLKQEDLNSKMVISHREVSNPILVLTNEDKISQVQDFFNRLNFINVSVDNLDANTTINYSAFDLIVFDNRDLPACARKDFLDKQTALDKQLILNRISKMEVVIENTSEFIVHYGEFLYWINANRNRAQAANSQFSLYARIREVIEFINTYRV